LGASTRTLGEEMTVKGQTGEGVKRRGRRGDDIAEGEPK
jgi:hypothetical protein